MLRIAIVALLVFAVRAHAQFLVKTIEEPQPPAAVDVATVLGLGGGATSDGAGYGLATASLDLRYTRAAPGLEQRGLHMCDIQERGCLWFFTGLDHDQTDGAGITLDASTLARESGDTTVLAGGRAWAARAGWQLAVRGDAQPTGSLRDAFWRSGRGIYQTNVRVDIPPMWALGSRSHQLAVIPGHVALGTRYAHDDGRWREAGFDRDIALVGARWQSRYHTLDFMEMRYVEWGAKTGSTGEVTSGTSASAIDVEASLDVRPLPWLALHGRGGVTSRDPVSAFTISGTSERSMGPNVFVGTYRGEARLHTDATSLVLGGGTWTRLDPTGHAVDHGYVGDVELVHTRRALELRGSAQLGRLRRILVGSYAPPELARPPARMVMGRAAFDATLRLHASLYLAATAWVERSDRDDPRWSTPADALATRAGADLSAQWRFARRR